MAAFAYTAINAKGMEFDGTIAASDLAAALEQLRSKGLLAQQIERVNDAGSSAVGRDLQGDQAEVAPDLLAPVRDDDRRRA